MGLVEQVALPFDEYFDQTEDDILMLIGLGFRAYWAVEDVVKNCANRIDEVVGRYKRAQPVECNGKCTEACFDQAGPSEELGLGDKRKARERRNTE